MKHPAVYIMTNERNGTLYTGVTSNLVQRIYQHKTGASGFTAANNCKCLVWFEQHENMESAIQREKQIKGGSRSKKLRLIEIMNPDWQDLFESLTA